MTRSPLPPDVRHFILTTIPSVPFLEALLLLRRQVGQAATVGEVSRLLYLDEPLTARLLEDLAAAGLATANGEGPHRRYTVRTDDPALSATIEALAQCHANHLIDVTRLIHDQTQRSAARFADAFKLRKDR